MDEHPENCPGCADCFYDNSVEAVELRQIEQQQRQEEQAEQIEAALGLAPAVL